MTALREQYLVDGNGKRTAVLLPFEQWEEILVALEEYRDIVAFDEAVAEGSEAIPFEQALAEIERGDLD